MTDILRPETLSAIWILCVLALADLVTGVSHAIRAGMFRWDYVADWVGKHLGGRVLPIAVVLVLAQWAEPLYAIAATASATYVAETIASIRSNLEVQSAE